MEEMPSDNRAPLTRRSKLDDILADRKAFLNLSSAEPLSLPEIVREQLEIFEKNLQLLSHLNGQKGADLRRLAAEERTPEASHLQRLYEWSLRVAKEGGSASDEIIASPPFPEFTELSGEELYERLLFGQKNPHVGHAKHEETLLQKTSEALGVETGKWMDLVEPLLNQPDKQKAVIEKVGFIPEEIYTKRKFKNIPAEKIVAFIESLRELESTTLRHEALHERAKAINYFLSSRRAEALRRKDRDNFTLDTNGIFINLAGFYTHLPYAFVSDDALSELERGNWLPEEKIDEIRIQRAAANNVQSSVAEIRQKQLDEINGKLPGADIRCWTDTPDVISKSVCEQGLIIPDAWIEQYNSPSELAKLMRLAEDITGELSGKAIAEEADIFTGYKITEFAKEEYEIRSKILNDPAYYNVAKIVRHFLRHVPKNAEGEYAVFRGQYKKSRDGDQHSFIEVLDKGELSRVLINEGKHVTPDVRAGLDSLPLFTRESYEGLESALQAYRSFCASAEGLSRGDDTERHFREAENCVHFILNNVSAKYPQVAELFESLKKDPKKDMTAFTNLVEEARAEYSEFLYKNIRSQERFVENFSPEIKTSDITFGSDFLELVKINSPHDYNEEVSLAPFPIRLVTLDYRIADPSQTIPFHVEESCLDALRLDRNRPLINVIGGCKALDNVKNPLRLFSEAVVRVAHQNRANVAVPGTQSGIGTEFGLQNMHYKNHYGHLPHADQAHIFAINPGGSAYYPGNPFFDKKTLAAAQTAVDSIITPVSAEWEKAGYEKYTSKYLIHVAYMEALYRRMSANQPYVTVVGNGGLYSIMEVLECMKGNTNLLLVADSGRFAEAASVLLPHLDTILGARSKEATAFEILNNNLNQKAFDEFCKKDFGAGEFTENADHQVYRDFFLRFLAAAAHKKGNIVVTRLDSVEDDLKRVVAK